MVSSLLLPLVLFNVVELRKQLLNLGGISLVFQTVLLLTVIQKAPQLMPLRATDINCLGLLNSKCNRSRL